MRNRTSKMLNFLELAAPDEEGAKPGLKLPDVLGTRYSRWKLQQGQVIF